MSIFNDARRQQPRLFWFTMAAAAVVLALGIAATVFVAWQLSMQGDRLGLLERERDAASAAAEQNARAAQANGQALDQANGDLQAKGLPTVPTPNVPAATGPQGAAGPRGPAGATGQQGPPGQNGTDGRDGTRGPAGVAGAAGAPGKDGQDGSSAIGARGLPGPSGSPGAAGSAGPAGAPGVGIASITRDPETCELVVTLTDGQVVNLGDVCGAPGAQGPVGPAGPPGPPGTSSTDTPSRPDTPTGEPTTDPTEETP